MPEEPIRHLRSAWAEETCAQAEQRGIFFRLVGSHGQILAGSRLPAESGLAQSLGEGRHGWEMQQHCP